MLVEITLGIGQIFMRDGGKHRAQSYQFSQRLCVLRTQLLISCLLSMISYRFVILPDAELSKVSLGHKMHLADDFFIWQPA